MNRWILTIGSHDVQLNTNDHWTELVDEIRKPGMLAFTPQANAEHKGKFRVPARVLGRAYGQEDAEEYAEDLIFPLIDNYLEELSGETLERVTLVLTDQSNIFSAAGLSRLHPYWQDTITLFPLLERYLKQRLQASSPELQVEKLLLQPSKSGPGLDHWDNVLELTREQFKSLELPQESEGVKDVVYVSHQAGTPALSSAVQFMALAKFGSRVKFLVSNEQDAQLTQVLDNSRYLRGIRIQEAKALLDRYDYAGVQSLLEAELRDAEQDDKASPRGRLKLLLEAAIQWNFARFQNFSDLLEASTIDLADVDLPGADNWWWNAYESAYLATIRLNQQNNTVEAMFHSFRAVEGLLKQWLEQQEQERIAQGLGVFQRRGNQIVLPRELEDTDWKGDPRTIRYANPFGKGLYFVLDSIRNIQEETSPDIYIFGNSVFEHRNSLFHVLKGLEHLEVYSCWGFEVDDNLSETKLKKLDQAWQTRVLNCLNFIAKKSFSSLAEASLISKVHTELEQAILALL